MESILWALFWAFAILLPLIILGILLWILDKLVEFTAPLKKALARLVPLALSILVVLWTTDPAMPSALRGLLWLLLLFAIPISIWVAWGIRKQIPEWQRAARNCEKATNDSIATWRKRLRLSKES